jgi:cytidine deaminase
MDKSIEIKYQVFDHVSELEPEDRALLEIAHNSLDQAYAPYSGFEVSACVKLHNGEILAGTNQENASYGLCICAEQNVLSTAGSQYKDEPVLTMAITARSGGETIDHPVSPCGACRQVISEFEDRQSQPIRILLQGEEGPILVFRSVKELLPFSFSGKDLVSSQRLNDG